MKRRSILLAALVAGVVTAAGALAATAQDPGVTGDTILIGGTAPLSGEASSAAAVARGAEAYFKYVGERGGVNGRKIEYRYLDDGYDPARTVEAVRQLVEQDKVFALFNTLGTSNNLAVRDFLNQERVPQLFVASGASAWGAEQRKYPWTIGYMPSYRLEGTILARQILKTRPKAKIAVLYQDDDYGRDLLAGLEKGLGRRARMIVKAVGYYPVGSGLDSQVAELRATKADTFVVIAFAKFSTQALVKASRLGWRPQVYVSAVSSAASLMTAADRAGARAVTRGAISIVFGKDPSDPKWAADPAIKLFQAILKKYCCSGADLKNGYYVAGMAAAYTLVDVLKKAGKELTRDAVMNAARSLTEASNPFLLPGIVVRTGPNDGFPIDQVALQRWQDGHWNLISGLVTATG